MIDWSDHIIRNHEEHAMAKHAEQAQNKPQAETEPDLVLGGAPKEAENSTETRLRRLEEAVRYLGTGHAAVMKILNGEG